MNSIVYVYYMVLITPLCAIMFTSFGTNSEDKTDLQTDSLFQALLLSMAMVPIAWPSRWKVMDTISSTEAYNQFPLVVTITIAVYITFAVTKNVLTLRLEQN
jgi:archaellum biogenesis protein FlaJ (TadC family)